MFLHSFHSLLCTQSPETFSFLMRLSSSSQTTITTLAYIMIHEVRVTSFDDFAARPSKVAERERERERDAAQDQRKSTRIVYACVYEGQERHASDRKFIFKS